MLGLACGMITLAWLAAWCESTLRHALKSGSTVTRRERHSQWKIHAIKPGPEDAWICMYRWTARLQGACAGCMRVHFSCSSLHVRGPRLHIAVHRLCRKDLEELPYSALSFFTSRHFLCCRWRAAVATGELLRFTPPSGNGLVDATSFQPMFWVASLAVGEGQRQH